MATVGFGICLVGSVLVLIYMAQKNYEIIDIYYWSFLIMNPIIILAYWLKTRVTTVEAASVAFCFIYLDSTVILVLLIFAMLHTIGIKPKSWLKVVGYGAALVHAMIVWVCFDNRLYYQEMTIIDTGNGYATKMVSGPLKSIHYVFLLCILVSMLSVICLGFWKKDSYSRRTLLIYTTIVGIGMIIYFFEMIVDVDFSLLPYLYFITDVIIALDYDYMHTHDITSFISTHYEEQDKHGYVAIGLKKKFLNCNSNSYELLPELKLQKVDAFLTNDTQEMKALNELIDYFENGEGTSIEIKSKEKIYICEISYFSIRKDGKRQGYLIDIRDATEEKRNLEILSNYNDMLNEEVAEKTEHIFNIQRKIVLGMATMIENRDNNTGGHVKRTSDIISILVDEIKKQKTVMLEEQLAVDVIRAAPMHDLGKLQIDSNILCKPEKLTDEEYRIMKNHSIISGKMVMILLEGVEEEHFVKIAYNVARYHHERWDGKGYPEGLVGTMIPLEARIMAIADVYDALVSKRCYKEAMSFEQAKQIMCENMGKQFDPNLRQIFLGCVDKLEDYYRKSESKKNGFI